MSKLTNAFNALIALRSRTVSIRHPEDASDVSIKLAPSNYYRDAAGPAAITIEGHEYLIPKYSLDAVSFVLKKGDIITHPTDGEVVVDQIETLEELGSTILGFRVRTS